MVEPDAYWVNSPGQATNNEKNFIIMGLNYERPVAEALHSYGHRSESIMKEVYGSWDSSKPQHAWDYFAATNTDIPGNSGCGNIHFHLMDYQIMTTTTLSLLKVAAHI